MSHTLLRSSAFVRDARRLLRKRPDIADDFVQTLRLLGSDAFAARLKTHRLGGKLSNSWACSSGYDLRIVFSFT